MSRRDDFACRAPMHQARLRDENSKAVRMESTVLNMRRLTSYLLLLVGFCGATGASADAFTDGVRRDTEWLAGLPSRVPGTAGHLAAQQGLLERVEAIEGVQVWTQEFPVMAPTLERGELVVAAGAHKGTHAVFPVWPDLVRLKTTPQGGIHGRLTYVGEASLDALPADTLRGQIAVMEMSAYRRWKLPFSAGAAAVLLLGGTDDQAQPPAEQPLYMPRYYLPEGALADAVRRGEVAEATIHCDASWQSVTGRNIIALVKPAEGRGGSGLPVALAAPYDSMSIVMGLAPGADVAVDAAFLLNQLRRVAAEEVDRPLLFCFVDAYGINQLGMRELLSMLTVTDRDVTREAYEEQDAEMLERYRAYAQQVETLGPGREALEALCDKMQYRELQRFVKDAVAGEIMTLRESTGDARLEVYGLKTTLQELQESVAVEGPPEGHAAELSELEAQLAAAQAGLDQQTARTRQINRMLSQMLTKEALDETMLEEELSVWQAVHTRVRTQLAELENYAARFARFDRVRDAIIGEVGDPAGTGIPVAYLLGVDLSDAGTSVGLGRHCKHMEASQATPAKEITRWLKLLLKSPEDPFWSDSPQASAVLNAESIASHEDPEAFAVGNTDLITSPAFSYQLSAATLLTVDAWRPRVDTPQDRAERLDWGRLEPQLTVTRQLLARLLSDEAFPEPPKEFDSRRSRWRHGRGTIVTESVAETVPRTPMVGFKTVLVGGDPQKSVSGLRRHELVVTGADGMFRFPAMPGNTWQAGYREVRAYRLDERGRIVAALSDSASMIAGRVSTRVDLRENPKSSPARAVAFECVELNGPEFFDPRFLEPLSNFSLIDVTFGGTPKRFHFSVVNGQMFGLLKASTTWQLLLRAGSAGNRLVLLNLAEDFPEKGELSLRQAMKNGGFGLDEPLPSIPAHIAARDFYTINDWRMRRFKNAGIVNKVIEGLHQATAALLATADGAVAADDGGELRRSAASALANEIRTYEAVRAMGEDVTRGAIFLMILLVPFSVAMERLLFACRKIGARITTSVGIFVMMTMVLWSFHPSFRITTQPMIVLMAFAILVLSLLVVTMILRKFESDMEDLRRGRAEASGAETSRAGLVGSAVWLGIANMRKRKVRTALTATTIVLITFALLCFSSSTQYKNRRQFKIKNVTAPYPGVLIRQPGMREMHQRAYAEVENLLDGVAVPVPRYWWTASGLPNWRLHVRNARSGKQISLKAGLGLAPEEETLTHPGRFVPNWERFSQGGGCYLSESAAAELEVSPGGRVVVGGMDLELIGTFAASALDGLQMIDGQSMLPYDYTVEKEETQQSSAVQSELAAGIGLAPETDVAHVRGDDCIILPAALARHFGGRLRSLAMRAVSREAAEQITLDLMKVLAFPMYYGEGDDVKVVVATPLVPKPPRSLLIPLIISALIIFNTMLNSVSERKKEIHIYTSLGLAPRHVGILFLAESATYGLMGSVFGYIVGQGLAKVLTAFDLMGGITLNYSGSNVVMTMGMVMAVVLLSSIVPAIMAGKLATPSDDMKWSVPEPKDGVIRELLPFTVTRAAAGGLIAFVCEFMEAHEDGGIGEFTTDNVQILPPDDGYVAGVRAMTWLAPYDLGVRQEVRITVHDDIEDICSIRVELMYGSGQVKTWWRLNRTFLDELRRQLLGWRKVKPERMMAYIRQAALSAQA